MSSCASPVCDRPVKGRGLCVTHYMRWYRTGDAQLAEPIGAAMRGHGPRLPASPLVEAVERRGGIHAVLPDYRSGEGRRLRRAYYRARQRGYLSEPMADDLAVNLLGVHPMDLWGVLV